MSQRECDVQHDRNSFTTNMRYAHPAAMPMVGWVFTTELGAGPWITPYVTVVDKSYELTQQLPPNPELPSTNIIRAAFNALGNVF